MDTNLGDFDDKYAKQFDNVAPDNPFDDEVEKEHFHSIIAAFKYYKTAALQRVSRREQFVSGLPERHRRRLVSYARSLQLMRSAIQHNNNIICLMIEDAQTIFENVPSEDLLPSHSRTTVDNGQFLDESDTPKPKPHDIEKVQYVLKQVVRDWSSAGAEERRQCYTPIIEEIQREFPSPSGVSVLVPGAGLGRLAYEIAVLGYICQGNEFSFFMLFASNFVLNKCHEVNKYTLHPWVHQFVNNLACEHQLRAISFPDTSPSALHGQAFSMVAGDFVEVYTTEGEWDCVATCFFIDCAPNVIDFVETIFNILKAGGIWVNIGPLLYHYCDMDSEGSIEPPFDILCDIIKDVGFVIEVHSSSYGSYWFFISVLSLWLLVLVLVFKYNLDWKSETAVKTKYFHNPNSMLQHEYDSVFLVCRKPRASTNPDH